MHPAPGDRRPRSRQLARQPRGTPTRRHAADVASTHRSRRPVEAPDLALRLADLDPDQCLILLREKGETVRWQPVSPTLMGRLVQHGQERHAPADRRLLRYAGGRPARSPGAGR